MPSGTRYKYEVEKLTGLLVLDRPILTPVPVNYGSIPGTLCADGDPLDVFIASSEPIPPLTIVEIEPVGIVQGFDGNKQDDKVLAYVKGDQHTKTIMSQPEMTRLVVEYLKTYKTGFEVGEVSNEDKAELEIERARKYFKTMKDILLKEY